MKKHNLYVDFHILQTVPPSCVNRDDTGSPKTAKYGGVTRARVSSQAWKRAMRVMFRETVFDPEQVGIRTKRIVGMVAEQIAKQNPQADAETLAKEALEFAGIKVKDAQKGTDALFFMSEEQAKTLATLILRGEKNQKTYKGALKDAPSIDMALFGRMVANAHLLSYDAAAQVAHSISTHAVENEYDYFTAVDDLAPEDNAGAGHIGTQEFNSATLYRYATVNLMELARSKGRKEIPSILRGFAEAFVRSMPTGKQNSFANRTLPELVYVTIRQDQPVYLGGAFEKPVEAGRGGYVRGSVDALKAYAEKTYENYGMPPKKAFAVGDGLDEMAETLTLPDLLDKLESAVRVELESGVQ
ncbi:MAG: type I-E CRISPR-associated protein Cas7/Cse4/CasC [Clostridiales bacterium]|nr:type I-E CRISPR-associated protein Cas7/Cse4/CasC [Clostridiales bacterium]